MDHYIEQKANFQVPFVALYLRGQIASPSGFGPLSLLYCGVQHQDRSLSPLLPSLLARYAAFPL
jgi:hypothetical protein